MLKWVLSPVALLAFGMLGSHSVLEPVPDTRRDFDALGTVYVTGGNPRGGAFFKASGGNPGFMVRIRNWDTTRPVRSLTAFVGFSPNATTRVVSATVRGVSPVEGQVHRGSVPEASVDERGMIQLTNMTLEPAETIALYVTLSSTPTAAYGFSFEAVY